MAPLVIFPFIYNNKGMTDGNVAYGDSISITLVVGQGRGRGRGGGHGLGRDQGLGGPGYGASVPEEYYTGTKVDFPPDISLLTEYQCLSDRIHKDKCLTMYNRMPPPGAMRDGKIVDVVGKRETLPHRNKYEVYLEYSFSRQCS
jgi:hypothetical protein